MTAAAGEKERLKVFLSYSRKDTLRFADQIVAALEICGFEPIIDRHEISGGEDWKRRLGDLILSADTVVFVMSPMSAASPICKWEVEETDRLGKRLLPIIAMPLGAAEVPKRLQDLNYIFFYDEPAVPDSGFGDGLKKLVTALNSDLDWLREHTVIAGRAQRWQSRGRDADSLIRGAILAEAERWLAARPLNAPEITANMRSYLEASREAEDAIAQAALKRVTEMEAAQAAREAALQEAEAAVARAEAAARERAEAQKQQAAALAQVEDEQKERAKAQQRAQRRAWAVVGLGLVTLLGTLFVAREAERRETRVMLSKAADAMSEGRYDRAMRYALSGLPPQASIPVMSQWSSSLEGRLASAAMLSRLKLRVSGQASLSPDGKLVVTTSKNRALILDSVTGETRAELAGHTELISTASFSPDGKRVATASGDKTARIWDAASGRSIAVCSGHTGRVESATFDGTGTKIVTTSWDGSARIWEVDSGRELARLEEAGRRAEWALFTPDGKRVLIAYGYNPLVLWDVQTGRKEREFRWETYSFADAAFSPDGKLLATATGGDLVVAKSDNSARLWDVETGAAVGALLGHTDSVTSISFSPDGKRILTTSGDKTARIWDVESKTAITVLEGHTERVSSGEFSSEGTQVVTASDDKTARVWDVASGKAVLTLEGSEGRPWKASFAPDGKRVLTRSMDGKSRVWDIATGKDQDTLKAHENTVTTAMFSPDGKRVLTASQDETVRIWDASSKHQIAALAGGRNISDARFTADGRLVTTVASDGKASMWDAASGQSLFDLGSKVAGLKSAAFSADGKWTAYGLADGTARVLSTDSTSNAAPTDLVGHKDAVTMMAMGPDGSRVVTASKDLTLRLWDARTGKEMAVEQIPKGHTVQAVFSADGKRIATQVRARPGMLREKAIKLWDAATGKLLFRFEPKSGEFGHAAFSSDGEHIVATSRLGFAHVLSTRSGVIEQLSGGGQWFAGAFSPDGRRLATTTFDSVVLWDTQLWARIGTFKTHDHGVYDVAFSPDGSRMVTSGGDTVAKIWDTSWHTLTGPALRDRVCAERLAGAQEFTDEELADPILSGIDKDDPAERNPCLRRGPLSAAYYKQTVLHWWRKLSRLVARPSAEPSLAR